jgi:uncharacterized spore protein YtfJ
MVAMRADSTVVYGDPIERDGVTVVPVARVKFGFGGGFGHARSGLSNGDSGGGGGVNITPLGYIEIRDGHAEYHTLRDPYEVAKTIVIGSLIGLFLLRPLLRGAKKS